MDQTIEDCFKRVKIQILDHFALSADALARLSLST